MTGIPTPAELRERLDDADARTLKQVMDRIASELNKRYPEESAILIEYPRIRQRVSQQAAALLKDRGWDLRFEDRQDAAYGSRDPRDHDDGKRTIFTVREL